MPSSAAKWRGNIEAEQQLSQARGRSDVNDFKWRRRDLLSRPQPRCVTGYSFRKNRTTEYIVLKEGLDCGLVHVALHDLRRTCASLCHGAGGEREQIQFRLGQVSIKTTERYLGYKQKLQNAVNDRLRIELKPSGSNS